MAKKGSESNFIIINDSKSSTQPYNDTQSSNSPPRSHKRAYSDTIKAKSVFGKAERFVGNKNTSVIPGPGFYSLDKPDNALIIRRTCKIGKSTRDSNWIKNSNDPGPGKYEVDGFDRLKRKIAYNISFGEGKRHDISSPEKKLLPAPGSYETNVSSLSLKMNNTNHVSDGSHSFGYSNRFPELANGITDENLEIGTKLGPGSYNIADDLLLKQHGVSFGSRYYPIRLPRKPGPGSYNPRLPNLAKFFSFGTSTRTTFKGKNKSNSDPGPGQYKLPSVFDKAAKKKHLLIYVKEESDLGGNDDD